MRLLLITSMFSVSAFANPICAIDDSKSWFEEEPYIIDESNYPETRTLSELFQYTSKKYGYCENGCRSLAEMNAYAMASDHLWEEVESTQGLQLRWSCGGEVRCTDELAENVRCTVEVGDCDVLTWTGSPYLYILITKIYSLECRGDLNCDWENKNTNECCMVTSEATNVK